MTEPSANGTAPEASASEETGPMTFEKMVGGANEKVSQIEEPGDDTEADDSDDAPDSDGEDSSDDTSSEESSDEGGEEEDTEEPSESEEDSEGADKPEEEPELEKAAKLAKGKTVSLKQGDKEFQISETAKFTFEKDGETITMTLKEAQNNLLTKQKIDREFSALDREKKTVERDKREVLKKQIEYAETEDSLSLLKDAAHSGDIFAISQAALGLFSKGDSDVAQKLFDQLITLTTEVSTMTEDQLKAPVTNSQLKFKNTLLERENKRNTTQVERGKQQAWVHNLAKENNIPWDEYVERYGALKEVDKRRVEQGLRPYLHDKITYEEAAKEVVKYAKATREWNRVTNLVKKVDPKAISDTKLIEQVCHLTDSTFSEKDMLDIIRGALGKSAPVKKVSKPNDSIKEVAKKVESKTPTKKAAPPKKVPEGKETKKDEEDEGPVTFSKIIARAEKGA